MMNKNNSPPILILNFKNYPEVSGQKCIELAKAAEKVAKSFDELIQIVVFSSSTRTIVGQ